MCQFEGLMQNMHTLLYKCDMLTIRLFARFGNEFKQEKQSLKAKHLQKIGSGLKTLKKKKICYSSDTKLFNDDDDDDDDAIQVLPAFHGVY